MKCVSYNIQYGIGLDGRYDIGRICNAVEGADLIALQEVTRNSPTNEGRDMVAEITAALPDYFFVYGPNFEADFGSRVENGRADHRHLPVRQHGAVEEPDQAVAQPAPAAQPQLRQARPAARSAGGAGGHAAGAGPLLFGPSRPSQPRRADRPARLPARAGTGLSAGGRRAHRARRNGLSRAAAAGSLRAARRLQHARGLPRSISRSRRGPTPKWARR